MSGERILVIEDSASVARGLEYGLGKEDFAVRCARDGAGGLELFRTWNPRLLILDIRLPDMSGFDVCRAIRGEGRREPILMLTARDEEMDKVLGLELGADDYVVKPYQLRELVSRVRALLRRAYGELAASAGSERISFGDLVIDPDLMAVERGGRRVNLTPTEFRLLRYLAERPERLLSRAQIIEAVWGYTADIGYDRTVDVHVRRLREKIEDDPGSPRWIQTVRGFGYRFASVTKT
ncbi:MAG: response regulator transcription factor [Spirochaetaceae bacterium]|nr:response regulator transcription factor [Spirochaetaceae bacterium]MDE0221710.1 response regulator transcription factor [Spirochaetaceae bacterium]